MYYLPNELSRKIWSYLYPIDKIKNSEINNIEIGTSVNNIYNKINYCKKCRLVSINYDICCVDDYNKFLL